MSCPSSGKPQFILQLFQRSFSHGANPIYSQFRRPFDRSRVSIPFPLRQMRQRLPVTVPAFHGGKNFRNTFYPPTQLRGGFLGGGGGGVLSSARHPGGRAPTRPRPPRRRRRTPRSSIT